MNNPAPSPLRRLFAFVVLSCLPAILTAQVVVFDSMALTSSGPITLSAGGYITAQRITVSGEMTTLTDVSITVLNIPSATWSAALRLYSDNGGTPMTAGNFPNAYLRDIGTITNSADTGTVAFDLTLTSLSAGVYWLSVESTAGSANVYSNSGSSGGSGPWLTPDDYTIALTPGTYYEGSVNNTLELRISAIPEPSTYAAILGGLALAGVIVARRRYKAA